MHYCLFEDLCVHLVSLPHLLWVQQAWRWGICYICIGDGVLALLWVRKAEKDSLCPDSPIMDLEISCERFPCTLYSTCRSNITLAALPFLFSRVVFARTALDDSHDTGRASGFAERLNTLRGVCVSNIATGISFRKTQLRRNYSGETPLGLSLGRPRLEIVVASNFPPVGYTTYLHPPTRYLISKQHTPDIPLLVDCRDFVLHPRETPLVLLPTPRTCTLLLAPGRSPSTPLIRTRRHALALPLTAARPSAPQRDTSELCSSEDFPNLRHCGHQSAP